jgi:hypothetical protein
MTATRSRPEAALPWTQALELLFCGDGDDDDNDDEKRAIARQTTTCSRTSRRRTFPVELVVVGLLCGANFEDATVQLQLFRRASRPPSPACWTATGNRLQGGDSRASKV